MQNRNPNSPGRSRRLWTGEPLEGRTILMHVEQGLGDAIQFMRYVVQVKRGAGTCCCCANGSLCSWPSRGVPAASTGLSLAVTGCQSSTCTRRS